MKLTVNAPINSVSFGNVSYNIIREFYKKNFHLSFFPIGDKIGFETFDKVDQSFAQYVNNAAANRLTSFDVNHPCFKLWHIAGSEARHARKQALLTFHETSKLTPNEINILKNQDLVFVTSNFTKSVFEAHNINNVYFVPLGFDEDFGKTNRTYLEDKIHFGLFGKFEYRKNTARIIKNWLKLFGNNPKYQLTCAVTNPFLDKNTFQNQIMHILEGKNYNNINFLSFMATNSEVNDYLNSIDIDLGGLSGSEGWNLPSFNATCLGKWSVVLNATAHKDWATTENSILIESSRMKEAHDGIFFNKGYAFNQGEFFDITDDEMQSAILKSLDYAKKPNPEGENLRNKFTYLNTTETIINTIRDTM
jgi:glycosyltransferase involved in cell wall biosynthesis